MLKHTKRLLEIWRIAAYYRLDTLLTPEIIAEFNLPEDSLGKAQLLRLHPAAWFSPQHKNPLRLKQALEEMGPLYIKLGQLLSTRRDLIPPHLIEPLSLLQDQVTPFDTQVAIKRIEKALGGHLLDLFTEFNEIPLAAASIAQVYTAVSKDGKHVVIKVTRPELEQQIKQDFALLTTIGLKLEDELEAARALHLVEIIEDYKQVMLNEIDLRLEAENATIMRKNFLGSGQLYVPEVYQSTKDVIVAERIYGLPVSQIAVMDDNNIDRAYLGELGLKIFFTQVLRDNFFHADMHPGNVFVDISNPAKPQYIALDCAIIGQLSDTDRMTVARLLLATMQSNFSQLVIIAHQAGWIPPGTDQFALSNAMKRAVSPMIEKPMDELDFALVLVQIMDIARRFKLEIPPQLTLLLKTLVHVEGLGRELYPKLNIWKLTKPILADWLKTQVHPSRALQMAKEQLPGILMTATDLPALITDSLHGLRQQALWQDRQWRALQDLKRNQVNQQQRQWVSYSVLILLIALLSLKQVIITTLVVPVAILWIMWRANKA